MASEFEKWITLGQAMGLEGPDLRQFVSQQQADERVRRAEEREFEKIRLEQQRQSEERSRQSEERLRDSELKRIEMEKDKQIELVRIESEGRKLAMEAEEKRRAEEKKFEFELELRKLETNREIELRRIPASTRTRGPCGQSGLEVGYPRRDRRGI